MSTSPVSIFLPSLLLTNSSCTRDHDAVTLGECQWLHLDLISNVVDQCRKIFASANYAFTSMPTYPSGQIGFILCAKDGSVDVTSKWAVRDRSSRGMGGGYSHVERSVILEICHSRNQSF